MKWYWWLLIAIALIVIGVIIYRNNLKKAKVQEVKDNLASYKKELLEIESFLQARPSDPNDADYVSKRNAYMARKNELIKFFLERLGCKEDEGVDTSTWTCGK